MNFREFAEKSIVILDGAMGSMLERRGMQAGERSEMRSLTHPDQITEIHRLYYESGASVVNTNTFGCSPLRYSDDELRELVGAAVRCAEAARSTARGVGARFISLDIGPLGRLLAPFGDLDFDTAYEAFSRLVRIGTSFGVDLVTVETMTTTLEAKAALLAVRDNTELPVMVTLAFSEDGKLLSGATPEAAVAMLEGLGADYIGANCSAGPKSLMPVIERVVSASGVPVVFKPNAGLPRIEGQSTVYDLTPAEFAEYMRAAAKLGVRLVGGCCGTDPSYIAALADAVKDLTPCQVLPKNTTVISSFAKHVEIGGGITVIGETINATGKKLMREAVRRLDIEYIVNTAIAEEDAGAHVLDVNVGTPEISEEDFLPQVISALQYSVSLPLCIDTASPAAMERALRIYDGKPLINSVCGKQESMDAVFPLQKKYGGAVIALTLDENGIPDTAEGRVKIAERILREAARYGISARDVIFDPLALTVSSDPMSATKALAAIRDITVRLGCKTSLGVSNVSFGLPERVRLNSAFLTMAAAAGLTAAIINPASEEMMSAVRASEALLGYDGALIRYVDSAAKNTAKTAPVSQNTARITLKDAVVRGLADSAVTLVREALATRAPLDIVNEDIVPALGEVGEGYEAGRIFLPGLLLAADAASSAFAVIRGASASATAANRGTVLLATVKGDVHDIGKNIVKLLLENYGFAVTDLGRDVSVETMLDALSSGSYGILALSALMTTTAREMEYAIKRIKPLYPNLKIIVGGAVVTEAYAEKIGADGYAPDAMAAVRLCDKLLNG